MARRTRPKAFSDKPYGLTAFAHRSIGDGREIESRCGEKLFDKFQRQRVPDGARDGPLAGGVVAEHLHDEPTTRSRRDVLEFQAYASREWTSLAIVRE